MVDGVLKLDNDAGTTIIDITKELAFHYEIPKLKIKNGQLNKIPNDFIRMKNPPSYIPNSCTVFEHVKYPKLRIMIIGS